MDQRTGTFIDSETGQNDPEGNHWLTLTYIDERGRLTQLTLIMTQKQFDSQFAL